MEDVLQPQAAQCAQRRRNVAMRQGAGDGEGLVEGNQRLALEQQSQAGYLLLGPVGKVGQGDLADLAAFANGLTQQNRGRGASVRYYVDIHGFIYATQYVQCQDICSYYMGTWFHHQQPRPSPKSF